MRILIPNNNRKQISISTDIPDILNDVAFALKSIEQVCGLGSTEHDDEGDGAITISSKRHVMAEDLHKLEKAFGKKAIEFKQADAKWVGYNNGWNDWAKWKFVLLSGIQVIFNANGKDSLFSVIYE